MVVEGVLMKGTFVLEISVDLRACATKGGVSVLGAEVSESDLGTIMTAFEFKEPGLL